MPTINEHENSRESTSDAPRTGKVWWSADTIAEAEKLKAEYLAKGAIAVDLHQEEDRPVVAMIITLERARSTEILDHEVQSHEWLDVTDGEALPA